MGRAEEILSLFEEVNNATRLTDFFIDKIDLSRDFKLMIKLKKSKKLQKLAADIYDVIEKTAPDILQATFVSSVGGEGDNIGTLNQLLNPKVPKKSLDLLNKNPKMRQLSTEFMIEIDKLLPSPLKSKDKFVFKGFK